MDFSQPRQRINASMIPSNTGKGVCLLGMVQNVDNTGSSFKMTSSDGQMVNIQMQEPLQELLEGLVEVHGDVQDDCSVVCYNYILFTPENAQSFDMESYDKAVQLTQQVPQHYIQGVQPQQQE